MTNNRLCKTCLGPYKSKTIWSCIIDYSILGGFYIVVEFHQGGSAYNRATQSSSLYVPLVAKLSYLSLRSLKLCLHKKFTEEIGEVNVWPSQTLEHTWYLYVVYCGADLEKKDFLWTLKSWEYRFGGKTRKLLQIWNCDRTA